MLRYWGRRRTRDGVCQGECGASQHNGSSRSLKKQMQAPHPPPPLTLLFHAYNSRSIPLLTLTQQTQDTFSLSGHAFQPLHAKTNEQSQPQHWQPFCYFWLPAPAPAAAVAAVGGRYSSSSLVSGSSNSPAVGATCPDSQV